MDVKQCAKLVVLTKNYIDDQARLGKIKARLANIMSRRHSDGDLELFSESSMYKEFRERLIKNLQSAIAELEGKWTMYQPQDVLDFLVGNDSHIERNLNNG